MASTGNPIICTSSNCSRACRRITACGSRSCVTFAICRCNSMSAMLCLARSFSAIRAMSKRPARRPNGSARGRGRSAREVPGRRSPVLRPVAVGPRAAALALGHARTLAAAGPRTAQANDREVREGVSGYPRSEPRRTTISSIGVCLRIGPTRRGTAITRRSIISKIRESSGWCTACTCW